MNTDGFKNELAALGTKLDGRLAILPGNTPIAFEFPEAADLTDPRVAAAARIVRAAATLSAELAAINANPDHSDAYKARKVTETNERGAAALSAEMATAEKLVADFDASDARDAIVPALAPDDVGSALVDFEARQYLRAMRDDEAIQLAHEIAAGRHSRLRDAILRTPVPLHPALTQVAAAAFVDAQVKSDPRGARLRAAAREVNDALRMTATHARGAMPLSTNGTRPDQSLSL